MIEKKHVAIIGGGITGIAAAEELSRREISVTIVEKSSYVGGHASRLSCKATEACVKCGACMVHDHLARIAGRKNIHLLTETRIVDVDQTAGFSLGYRSQPAPNDAIEPDTEGRSGQLQADAVLISSGFMPYDPTGKPYGYGRFPDVITTLDAEQILQTHGSLIRPSDGAAPKRIAFIQCVGSRDKRIGHPWCSRICCGSSLKTAGLVLHQHPETAVTFFYIDVQSFGKDFQIYYDRIQRKVRLVRAIPGGIVADENGCLNLAYFDPDTNRSIEAPYDMAVLAVGLSPSADNRQLAALLGIDLDEYGFFKADGLASDAISRGIFSAGASLAPMSIADSIESAGKTAWDIVQYLESTSSDG